MKEISLEDLKYPIGKFQWPGQPKQQEIQAWIDEIERFPQDLKTVVEQLPVELYQRPYRPDGWTVQQLVHHIADSHLNAYIRFKWALTEDNPTIKAYDEKKWALTPEVATAPIAYSVKLLESLHMRWGALLRNMKAYEWERTYIHPETGKVNSLGATAASYAWHGKHHLAQIRGLMTRFDG